MHEDLLGYLLGALEPHEMRRVEQLLHDSAEAREELAKLEASLMPLDEVEPIEEPPADLVSRTMAAIPPMQPMSSLAGDDSDLLPMAATSEPPVGIGRRWIDWASGAIAAAVLLGLLLPSLAEGRLQARKSGCADQLRQWGTKIGTFVARTTDRRLPKVAKQGPESFAGMYAVRLANAGLLEDESIRWCPSLDMPPPITLKGKVPSQGNPNAIATIDQLHAASSDQLSRIQRMAGGHYAYTLGVVEENTFDAPRYQSRSSFAVMSDAPMVAIDENGIARNYMGHGSTGLNVLYEDGSVRFLSLSVLVSIPDHPLFNRNGQVEAGVDANDATLAPSWSPPFKSVLDQGSSEAGSALEF